MLGRRMRFAGIFLALIGGIIAAAACDTGEPELPDTTSASVLAYLEEVDYQNNEDWNLWPGLGEKYTGQQPHGLLLTTYLNPLAYDALTGKKGSMPNDAIIVKENYTPEGEFAANTVMYKKAGYNPEHNDWFWLKVLPDGTVEAEGMVVGCQACHGLPDRKANDYIVTGPLK